MVTKGQKIEEVIVALGEVHGHAHRVKGNLVAVEDFEMVSDRMMYEVKEKPAQITHEEHDPLVFTVGTWTSVPTEEFDPFNEIMIRARD